MKINMKRPTEEELLSLLKRIESGKLTITLDKIASTEAIKTENGVFHFDTSNKWGVGVFVDCGKFDYIDYIQHGGMRLDHGKLDQYYPGVREYSLTFRDPSLAKKIWGIEAKIYAGQ